MYEWHRYIREFCQGRGGVGHCCATGHCCRSSHVVMEMTSLVQANSPTPCGSERVEAPCQLPLLYLYQSPSPPNTSRTLELGN